MDVRAFDRLCLQWLSNCLSESMLIWTKLAVVAGSLANVRKELCSALQNALKTPRIDLISNYHWCLMPLMTSEREMPKRQPLSEGSHKIV